MKSPALKLAIGLVLAAALLGGDLIALMGH